MSNETKNLNPEQLRPLLDAIASSTALLEEKVGDHAELARLRAAAHSLMELVEAKPKVASESLSVVPGQRVLYIEDEAVNFNLVSDTFAQLRPNIALTQAGSGGDGLTAARTFNPDVILLDLNLPDMHGSEVLRTLQQDPVTEKTPVIVLSADATASQIERLLSSGARNYLIKPFDIDEFLAVVDSTFEQIAR